MVQPCMAMVDTLHEKMLFKPWQVVSLVSSALADMYNVEEDSFGYDWLTDHERHVLKWAQTNKIDIYTSQ